MTKKEIQKELVAKDACDVSKKDVKKALKLLVKRGDVVKDGKKYKIIITTSSADDDDGSHSDDDSRSHNSLSLEDDKNIHEDEDDLRGGEAAAAAVAPLVPIAERLRQTAQIERSEDNSNSKQKIDLDEEIRRLEAELAESDNDDENSDHDDDSSDDDQSTDQNTTSQSDGIICLSSMADERIIPLPQGALPQNKRRTLKNIDSGGDGEPKKKKSKKQKATSKEEHAISEGLKDAVNELLSNYVPSSHLKKPFYCRVCQHQSTSESDFLSHKQSEFHKGAVQQEKKRTYCKLCRKQLTSIVQMEEHLKSRPHREKMDFVKSKQSGGGGRGQSRGHHGRDASGKQWC